MKFGEQRADLRVIKLGQAYETIKDPIKRRNYDLIWAQLQVNSRKSYGVPEQKKRERRLLPLRRMRMKRNRSEDDNVCDNGSHRRLSTRDMSSKPAGK